MYTSMFIELNSSLTVFIIFVVSYFVYKKESLGVETYLKISELSYYLSFIVSTVWCIYWLSHIEDLKEVGFILAFVFQLLFYTSTLRVGLILVNQLNRKSKI